MESPTSVANLQDLLQSNRDCKFLPVGAGTKNCLSVAQSATPVGTSQLAGIVSYDPTEFLISAQSGTSVRVLRETLGTNGQYFPFDPIFVDNGATIGGMIASGVSGPLHLPYSGIRDFVMEVALVDGLGKVVRGGGKVVKNAAGFDLPKLMVGSHGRMGILTEVTLKVLPEPQATESIAFQCSSLDQCLRLTQKLQAQVLPIVGIEFDSSFQCVVTFSGPADSLQHCMQRAALSAGMGGMRVDKSEALGSRALLHATLSAEEFLIRLATNTKFLTSSLAEISEVFSSYVVASGGCVIWAKVNSAFLDSLHRQLFEAGISGMILRSGAEESISSPLLGVPPSPSLLRRIKQALDPEQRFVDYSFRTLQCP